MLKRGVLLLVCMLSMVFGCRALASENCTAEYFSAKAQKLSRSLEISEPSLHMDFSGDSIIKQDAVRYIYDILVKGDSQFQINPAQAEDILNSCYDNAYIKEENKLAYASMIRHGVIGTRGRTNPDKVLTKENADLLFSRVHGLFKKKLPLTVGDVTISIGSSVDEVFLKFGEPQRVHKSQYGFDWYVYNSAYERFVMIGILDDIVTAYFTNCASFSYESSKALELIKDNSGNVQAVYYINQTVKQEADEAVQSALITDIINAHRVKNNLLTFISLPVELLPGLYNTDTRTEIVQGQSAISIYANMLKDFQEDGVLCHSFSTASTLSAKKQENNMWTVTAADSGNSIVSILAITSEAEKEQKSENPIRIKAPKLISPKNHETTSGGNLVFRLKKPASDRYLIKVYNCETESYDVNAYITTDKSYITVPSYMLTAGNYYRACVSAVDGEKEKAGNTVEFVYSAADTILEIKSPQKEYTTYEDEIEISAYSSAYTDLRVDVYDAKDKAVQTKEIKGKLSCTLDSLPAGKYYICITAVSHATGEDMAQEFINVTIKEIVQKVQEFVLRPGERYNYYYGDGKKELYFYDTDIIDVGGGQSRTKITQRRVPATVKYKALRQIIPCKTYTTGVSTAPVGAVSTELGDAIAALALSYKGVEYVWGGDNPSGFDCSGLVKYVLGRLGINNIPRTSALQFQHAGTFVEKHELMPGDLIYFQKKGKIHHVGIYIGNNQMVHAPSTGDVVKVSALSDDYFQREYAGAKRVWR